MNVDVDALERELTEISGSTPLAQAYLDCFALAERAISALRQQQEALKEAAAKQKISGGLLQENTAEIARLRKAIEQATEVRFPKSQRDYHNNVWKPLRQALEPTKGSDK